MFFYDYIIFKKNHFYDCIYINNANFISFPLDTNVFIIFNIHTFIPYMDISHTNNFIAFELESDAIYYVNTFLNNQIYSIQKVSMYRIYKMLIDLNYVSGIVIHKYHHKEYWRCLQSYIWNRYF